MDIKGPPAREGYRLAEQGPWVMIEYHATDAGLTADILYGAGVAPEDVLMSILMGAAALRPGSRVDVEIGVRQRTDGEQAGPVQWIGADLLDHFPSDQFEHVQRLVYRGTPEPINAQAGQQVHGVAPADTEPAILVDGVASGNAELVIEVRDGMCDWSVHAAGLPGPPTGVGGQVPVSVQLPGLILHGEAVTTEVITSPDGQRTSAQLAGTGGLRPQATT